MSEAPASHFFPKNAYIDGQWVDSKTSFDVINPSSGEVIASVTETSIENVERAIISAKRAQKQWAVKTAQERSELLMAWYTAILRDADQLAELMTMEQGKPLKDSVAEIQYGASYIQWFAEEGKRIYGDVVPSASAEKRIIVKKQPVGVVTAVTPWNFPNAMITRKAAAALAAGCSFVVKPAAETPLSALALAKLAEEAGIPPGIFNVVTGTDASAIGKVLTQHAMVNKFSFTGSTRTGKTLLKQCAEGVKKVSMELGGNAPFIVFDDADMEHAINQLIANKFRNGGQTCICVNRVYVQKASYGRFCEEVAKVVDGLIVGDGLKPTSDIGPMIHPQAALRVHALIKGAVEDGAKLLVGGKTVPDNAFISPCVLADVPQAAEVVSTEIFGPVIAILSFENEGEVLAAANATEYGLAAYVFTESMSRTIRMSESLEFGMVGVNDAIISNTAAPFGGVKQSGYGREGSKYGLDDYLNTKYVSLGNLD